jgi:phospholipid/cholesterol/gamma-HCH transport system substrate-binding protein
LHIVLETLPNQPRGYNASDVPRLGEKRGPSCLHLPEPPWNQQNPMRHQPNFNDGVDSPTGKGTSRVAPAWGQYAGTSEESGLLKSLLGPGLGLRTDDVPDLGDLLVAPMARGAEVTLR